MTNWAWQSVDSGLPVKDFISLWNQRGKLLEGALKDKQRTLGALDPRDFGARINGVSDDYTSVQRALDAAYAARISGVFLTKGNYAIDAADLRIPEGVALFGLKSTGEYDGGSPARGARLIRTAGGVSGPIVSLAKSSRLSELECVHQKSGGATTGIVRIGATAGEDVEYSPLDNVFIRGTRTGDVSGGTTCYGVMFSQPSVSPTKTRFFNPYSNVTVSEADVGWHLSRLCNGLQFVNIQTRECHVHWELIGIGTAASERVIENMFANIGMWAISILSPAIGIRLRYATGNTFSPYSYEAYGQGLDIPDDGTCYSNKFLGNRNELTASYIPSDSLDFDYASPVNHYSYSSMLLPTRTSGDRDSTGPGNRLVYLRQVTGTLPQINNALGTPLVAGGADNKTIVRFPAALTKASNRSLRATLRVWAYSPNNRGMHHLEIDFTVRNTTTVGGDQLRVTRVVNDGNATPEVTGLFFLTGVAAGTSFGIALMGGNNAAVSFDAIRVELEYTAMEYSTTVANMGALAGPSFVATAVTANDVTDAISLLTVANTAF